MNTVTTGVQWLTCYEAMNSEGSATEQKWYPRFQDLKISLRFRDFMISLRSHIDFKISYRFQDLNDIL